MQDSLWLEDVGDMCISTLDRLNAKVQKGIDITHEDKVMQDVCLGYLFLLNVCNDEGVLYKTGLSDNLKRNVTLH
jgi:hypothetical protein|tara:strand:- start:43 stop:267 length:225 start_codon:yes stop_codon:yes gene_type:complete